VIVDNLDLVRISITPRETNPPLIVDSYTVFAFPVTVQGLQTIPRRRCQIAQFYSAIDLAQLSPCYLLNRPKTPAALALVKPLGLRATERLDHRFILFRIAFNVKQ
jgi:hypothetical protein